VITCKQHTDNHFIPIYVYYLANKLQHFNKTFFQSLNPKFRNKTHTHVFQTCALSLDKAKHIICSWTLYPPKYQVFLGCWVYVVLFISHNQLRNTPYKTYSLMLISKFSYIRT